MSAPPKNAWHEHLKNGMVPRRDRVNTPVDYMGNRKCALLIAPAVSVYIYDTSGARSFNVWCCLLTILLCAVNYKLRSI